MSSDPFRRFTEVYARASQSGMVLPDACALATTGSDAQPSVRMVLLKCVDERGFVFYTNLESRKASELAANPKAALCFWWSSLREQVRIEGTVVQVDDTEADEYFATRPRGSQLSAWASRQSSELSSRDELIAAYDKTTKEYENRDVPRPPFWSGYRLSPERIEFWLGRDDRLHECYLYTRDGDGWKMSILSP